MTSNRNASGMADPTAYEAEMNIEYEKISEKAITAVRLSRSFLYGLGFELIGRIPIRHIKTGREFR